MLASQESMRYDQLRDVVAQRKPGWENLQNVSINFVPLEVEHLILNCKRVKYLILYVYIWWRLWTL